MISDGASAVCCELMDDCHTPKTCSAVDHAIALPGPCVSIAQRKRQYPVVGSQPSSGYLTLSVPTLSVATRSSALLEATRAGKKAGVGFDLGRWGACNYLHAYTHIKTSRCTE